MNSLHKKYVKGFHKKRKKKYSSIVSYFVLSAGFLCVSVLFISWGVGGGVIAVIYTHLGSHQSSLSSGAQSQLLIWPPKITFAE